MNGDTSGDEPDVGRPNVVLRRLAGLTPLQVRSGADLWSAYPPKAAGATYARLTRLQTCSGEDLSLDILPSPA